MLTALLRQAGYIVISWIENCDKEGVRDFVFEEWVHTKEAERCLNYDLEGATTYDLFIYYGLAGKDACVEMGAAYGHSVTIVGLYAKGEDLGLMRRVVSRWFDKYTELLDFCKEFYKSGGFEQMVNNSRSFGAWKHHISEDFEKDPSLLGKGNGPDAGATVFLDFDKMVEYLNKTGRRWHVCEFVCTKNDLEFIYPDNNWMARIKVSKPSLNGFHPLEEYNT